MAQDVDQLLLAHRDYYGQYHHHKEQMAYGATILYLGGAIWLATSGAELARSRNWDAPLILLVLVGALAGWAFVIWQLRNRAIASHIVAACTNLLSRRLAGAEQGPILTDTRAFHGVQLPHFLVDEIDQVEQASTFRGARLSNVITYGAMLALSVLAVLRL